MGPRRVAVAIATLALACGAAVAAAAPGRVEIAMRGNSFGPRRLEIALGDTVVWVNRDIVRHDAVKAGLFDSGELRGGESFQWIPADTGVVEYRCTIHQRMRGQIRVKPAR